MIFTEILFHGGEFLCQVPLFFGPRPACAISCKVIKAYERGEWRSTNSLRGGGLKGSLVNFAGDYLLTDSQAENMPK